MLDKVSVIIPIYNASRYLEECILSVLNQTYKQTEIILVNDGSTDESLSICQKIQVTHANILIVNQDNKGVSVARKNGVEKASGKWILFVDADDTIPQTAIEVLVRNSQSADIVVGTVCFDGPSKWPYPSKNNQMTGNKYVQKLLTKKIHSGPVAKLIKRTLFTTETFNVPREIICGEDYLMNLHLASNATRVIQISNEVYNYIFHEGSAMSAQPFSRINYVLKFNKLVYKAVYLRNKNLLAYVFLDAALRFAKYIKINIKIKLSKL